MHFTKVNGLGNDFIVIDGFNEKLPDNLPDLTRSICHRRFGVGGDGLIVILPSEKADLKMRIFNSDGSEPEMCGNGIRCFALLAYKKGLVDKHEISVETLAGIIKPTLIFNEDGSIKGIRVDMGEPRLVPQQIPVDYIGDTVVDKVIHVSDEYFNFTAVSMGNPHCVIFVDNTENAPVHTIGPLLERHVLFPQKTNVEFIEVINSQEIKMRVWERGAGETLACGTGACAAVVATVLNSKTERNVTVHLSGGNLLIEWQDNNHVFMTGPAEIVFEGKLIKYS